MIVTRLRQAFAELKASTGISRSEIEVLAVLEALGGPCRFNEIAKVLSVMNRQQLRTAISNLSEADQIRIYDGAADNSKRYGISKAGSAILGVFCAKVGCPP